MKALKKQTIHITNNTRRQYNKYITYKCILYVGVVHMCVQCIHSSFISHSFIHTFFHTFIHTFKHSYIHYHITHTNRHSSIPINPNWYQFDFNHDWYQFDINYRSIISIVPKNNYTLHITLPSHYYYNRRAVNSIINVSYLLYQTMHTYVIHTGLPELRRQYQ